MTNTKNDLSMNLLTVFESLRGFLTSDISIINPDTITVSQKPENSLAIIKVKVLNTAPSANGFGEIVFIGVKPVITCNATNQIFEKLKQSVKGKDVRRWSPSLEKSVFWYVNTWVEDDDEGYSTNHAKKLDGHTLFPGDKVDFEFKVPFESLPYISISVEGFISPGNLFRTGQVLQGFEKWSKPELITIIKAIIAMKIHNPIKLITNGIPEFGPKTTFEEISAFRKTVSESLSMIKNIKQQLQQSPKLHINLEIHNFIADVIMPYLNSVEKNCENALAALASGNMESIIGSVKDLRLSLENSLEIERKTQELVSKHEINFGDVGLK